jgi:YHS domain-containing protein
MSLSRRLLLSTTATLAVTAQSFAQPKAAIGGYDTVAYFTQGKATKGSEKFAHLWDGKTWLFASEEHRALFAGNPDKYAPQFAGLCAASLAGGAKITADPTHFMISDGRLFLFGGPVPPDIMAKDPQLVGKAETNYRKLN